MEEEKIVPSDWSKIKSVRVIPESELPTLADCPWPHPDSHATEAGYPIWGSYGGDSTRKRFYAQTSYLDTGRIIRLVFKVKKGVATPSHPLWIGLMGLDTLNEPEKMWDPSKWPWAGYLEDLPTVQDHYYLCVDLNEGFWTTSPIFLFFCTDAPYQTWYPIGYTAQSTLAPLNKYSLNEPGEADGWEEMDNYYHLLFIPYTNGAGAIIEPDTSIESPVFPSTAHEGTPYEFSFTQKNPTAFPCGCPSTLYYDIIDRDSGDPIGDKVTHTLVCGYGAINWGGSINFTGSGTFHGRLRAGHYAGGAWPVDDTYDFDVIITDGEEDWLEEAVTCKWVDGYQDHGPQVNTFDIDETIFAYSEVHTTGDLYGKTLRQEWWYDTGSGLEKKWEYSWTCPSHYTGWSTWTWWAIGQSYGCGTGHIKVYLDGVYLGKTNNFTITAPDCSHWTSRPLCIDAGCYWWGYGELPYCHDTPPVCELINNQTDCEANDCYWYNDSCHSDPQTEEVLADLIESQSTFYTGPFAPGSIETLAILAVKNIGTKAGRLHYYMYEYPGTPNENLIASNSYTPVNPGATHMFPAITLPVSNTIGTWPLGVKVWGESENEPSWGTMRTKQFNINFK